MVAEALDAHLRALEDQSVDALVFPAPQGDHLVAQNFRKRVWLPGVKAAGLAPLRLHGLRHTCASLAIAAGADVKVLQRMLGNASAALTLDRYGHLMPGQAESVAERLNEMARAAGHRPARLGRVHRRNQLGRTVSDLEPTEEHLRSDDRLDPDSHVVDRGGPLTVDGMLRNADATRSRFSWSGAPLVAVSAEITIGNWTVDLILAGPGCGTRRRCAETTVASVVDAGFGLLPSFAAPHHSVVLPASMKATSDACSRCSERSRGIRTPSGGSRERRTHHRRHAPGRRPAARRHRLRVGLPRPPPSRPESVPVR